MPETAHTGERGTFTVVFINENVREQFVVDVRQTADFPDVCGRPDEEYMPEVYQHVRVGGHEDVKAPVQERRLVLFTVLREVEQRLEPFPSGRNQMIVDVSAAVEVVGQDVGFCFLADDESAELFVFMEVFAKGFEVKHDAVLLYAGAEVAQLLP